MKFDSENCSCKQCNFNLSNKDAWYDGKNLYCDEECYMKNKRIRLVRVQTVKVNKEDQKRKYLDNFHKNKLYHYDNFINYDDFNCYFNNEHKLDKDNSFHEFVSATIVEGDRVIELTARMLGNDAYGDRVFVSASYSRISDELYGSHYSNKEAVYYRYDKYKDYVHKIIKLYQERINHEFNPRGIDAVRFKNGFNEFIKKGNTIK